MWTTLKFAIAAAILRVAPAVIARLLPHLRIHTSALTKMAYPIAKDIVLDLRDNARLDDWSEIHREAVERLRDEVGRRSRALAATARTAALQSIILAAYEEFVAGGPAARVRGDARSKEQGAGSEDSAAGEDRDAEDAERRRSDSSPEIHDGATA